MKKICLFFVGLFGFGAVTAQVPYDTVTVVDPQNFTLATSIDTALVQVISRKAGLNRRINFQTVKSYSTPDITLAWLGIDIEDTTGIATTYRDFFVTDNEGEVWFVDNTGKARKLYDPAQFQDLTISDDTIYISDGNFAILPGIAGTTIDSISYYGDTLRIYEGGDTIPFKAEIIGGDGNGIFDAANNLDTIRVDTVYLRDSLWVIGDGNQYIGIENATFEIIGEAGGSPDVSWRIAQEQTGFSVRNSGFASLNYAGMSSDTTGTVYLENTLDGAPFGWGRNRVGFDTYIGDSTGLLVQLAGAYPTSGQVLVAGADSLFQFADASVIGDGNGIIDALPAGDVTIDGSGNTLALVANELVVTSILGPNAGYLAVTDSTYNSINQTTYGTVDLASTPSAVLSAIQGVDNGYIVVKPKYTNITSDTLDVTGVTTFLGFPSGTDTDNQTIDTFTIVSNTLRLSLEDDAQAFKSVSLASYLDNTDAQTLSKSRDTITISGGNSIRTPGNGFLRDSITGATLTVDLKYYNNAVVVLKMESATNVTLTISNPWSILTDATYPTLEGQAGVYTFHFRGTSGTDNVTWPVNFYDMGGTALGTDALTTGTAYTCYYEPGEAKYYCQ